MKAMHELAEFIRSHDDFIVIGHIHPDGDAHGSVIALTLALNKLGKRAIAYLPNGFSKLYADFDCPIELADLNNLPFAPKTGFAVDVSDIERTGDAEAIFKRCESTCLLDHHESNSGFADVNYIDAKAAAAGELAVKLIDELGVPMDRSIAEWLYVAIVTDCGRFGFSCTRAETLEAAARLMREDIDVDAITRKLYSTRSECRTRLLGRLLNDMRFDSQKQICYALLRESTYAECGATPEDNDGIVNYLLEIRGVRIAFILEEKGRDAKVSLRSKPPMDVSTMVAKPLGGGGHACAAGISLKDTNIEAALERVLHYAHLAL